MKLSATPFKYFAIVLLVIQTFIMYNYKSMNKLHRDYNIDDHVFFLLISIPLLIITFYDVKYNTFSLKQLGIPVKYNENINYMLNLFGSYGIIQILAQDSGLKTGKVQRDTIQNTALFSVIALGMAFSVTSNRSQSLIAVLYYFHLKYVISNNKTSPVCFEDV